MLFKKFKNAEFLYIYKKNFFIGKSPLIETEALYKIMTDPKTNLEKIKLIDCSITYENEESIQNLDCLPCSIYINPLDISQSRKVKKITKEIIEKNLDKNPFDLPSEAIFSDLMKNYDLKRSDTIICYSRDGILCSARLWLVLKLFSLKTVYVLNGGFNKWKSERFPIVKGYTDIKNYKNTAAVDPKSRKSNLFSFLKDNNRILTTDEMMKFTYEISKNISKNDIIDTRSPESFKGLKEEPFPVLRKGTMNGSANLHYKLLLNENHTLISSEKFVDLLKDRGIDLDIVQDIAVFSGVGFSSCLAILAFDVIGKYEKIKFYSGGWLEMANVYELGSTVINKLTEYENSNNIRETSNDIFNRMGPQFKKRYDKQVEYEYKLKDVKEKNFEYLKRKDKLKKKLEGDYSSPEELF
jgi:thiosulfate/3-mercaptopyruvate sulfurtransferase